jgi:hypothetical protein
VKETDFQKKHQTPHQQAIAPFMILSKPSFPQHFNLPHKGSDIQEHVYLKLTKKKKGKIAGDIATR